MASTARRIRRSHRVVLAASALLLAFLGSGRAEPPAERVAADEDTPRPGRPSSTGLRVFRDPVTGELTSNPTAEQRQRFRLAARTGLERSTSGLTPFRLDEGGHGVNLRGRFQSALVVEVGPDGRLRMRCGDPAHPSAAHPHETHDAPAGTRGATPEK